MVYTRQGPCPVAAAPASTAWTAAPTKTGASGVCLSWARRNRASTIVPKCYDKLSSMYLRREEWGKGNSVKAARQTIEASHGF